MRSSLKWTVKTTETGRSCIKLNSSKDSKWTVCERDETERSPGIIVNGRKGKNWTVSRSVSVWSKEFFENRGMDMDTEFFENRGMDMDTEFFENRGVDMDVDTEIFKNRGVDMDMDTEIFENRGVDMDMDTEFSKIVAWTWTQRETGFHLTLLTVSHDPAP